MPLVLIARTKASLIVTQPPLNTLFTLFAPTVVRLGLVNQMKNPLIRDECCFIRTHI